MSDVLSRLGGAQQVDVKYKDMGDGSFALVVYAAGSGGGGGGGAVTIANGDDATQGAKADAAAGWYTSALSIVALLKLQFAAMVGAGSHVFGYSGGKLVTDAWTFLGTTRTKTYTYTGTDLTGESDWV